jgi:hypothetical protein
MATLAVSITEIDEPDHGSIQGILVSVPRLGVDCRVYVGGDQVFRIPQVKGWIGPVNGGHLILFNNEGKRFKVEAIASSKDFLP